MIAARSQPTRSEDGFWSVPSSDPVPPVQTLDRRDHFFSHKSRLMHAVSRPQQSCLVLEGQALIGMAIEAYLEDAGYHVQGPFCLGSDALASLATQTPAVAIVDFMLRDGPCTALARELRRRCVPFLVYSGRSRGPDTPSEFRDVPWIEKPADRADLLQALATMPLGLAKLQPRAVELSALGNRA